MAAEAATDEAEANGRSLDVGVTGLAASGDGVGMDAGGEISLSLMEAAVEAMVLIMEAVEAVLPGAENVDQG